MRHGLFTTFAILLCGCGSGGGPDSGVAFLAPATWTDTDWSQAGSYQGASNVETVNAPGDVVLASNPSDMRLFLNPSDQPGWLPRNFYPLAVHDGKLFAGYGGPPEGDVEGEDPHPGHEFAEIWKYDPASGQPMALQTVVDEQGIVIMKNRGGALFSPGIDAATAQGPNWGNLYRYNGVQWDRYHNLPWAVHVYDFELFNGSWFCSTCNWIGGAQVLSSSNQGMSWQVSLELQIPRIYALGVFGGNLYAQPDSIGLSANKLMKFNGTTWTEMSAPGMPHNDSGESLGRFVEHRGQFYFTTLGSMYKLIAAENRWESIYCPGPWGSGSWPMGAASLGGYFYHAAGYEVSGVRIYRSTVPGGPETWETVAGGFEQQPYGSYEKIRDFAMFRGRLYCCSNNPRDESQGGSIYVAAAGSSGSLLSNPHDFGNNVTGGNFSWTGIREMGMATNARFQVRSAPTSEGLAFASFTGPDGTQGSYYTGGEALASVTLGKRWFQYRIELTTTDARYTPSVASVTITASAAPVKPVFTQ